MNNCMACGSKMHKYTNGYYCPKCNLSVVNPIITPQINAVPLNQVSKDYIPVEWILNHPKFPSDKDKAKVIEDMIEDWRKESERKNNIQDR